MNQLVNIIRMYTNGLHMPNIRWTDVVEILIISFLVYHIFLWIKNTRAWSFLRGVIVILSFTLLAAIFNMTTILWIVEHVFSIAVVGIVVILQPELRRALEQLGRKDFLSNLFPFDSAKSLSGRFSDRTVQEIIRACFEMGKVKTGALIVLEQNQSLSEYERTGIEVDALLSSQLLINIFEHNTPLHDGAVIVRGNRVTSATCYLPLSDNMDLSKELGTRHRAAVGISEATDSMTVIVSEETGYVSVAYDGQMYRNLSSEELREKLLLIQNKQVEEKKRILWKKGRSKNEKQIDK